MATTRAEEPLGTDDVLAAASAARLGIGLGVLPVLPAGETVDGEHHYINRELSTLDYYSRVMCLAEDTGAPLLERAKFLAIFNSLLDEFFEIRVAGLKDQMAAGLSGTDPAGLTPGDQLKIIRSEVEALLDRRVQTFLDGLIPELADK